MYLTGFADEVSQDVKMQIKATKELGWNAIEARNVGGENIHNISDASFGDVCELLEASNIKINCFGSTIANWGRQVDDPFEVTIAQVERAIKRMQILGTKLIRIMSYAQSPGENQNKDERFRRLREISNRFIAAGITPVHENCMNYGGMSSHHSLELIENVPGLKLVFDTGNPVVSQDYSKAAGITQDPVEFYNHIKDHIAYIHIKDARLEDGKEQFLYPGEGSACIPKILQMLRDDNYDGGISIEPHMASIFHDKSSGTASEDQSYDIYVEYGRRLMWLMDSIKYRSSLYAVD